MAQLMLSDLYDALRAASVPVDKARAAATWVAGFARRIEVKLRIMLIPTGCQAGRLLRRQGTTGHDLREAGWLT